MTVTARRTPPPRAPRPPEAALTDVVAMVIFTNQVDDDENDAASCRRSVRRGNGSTKWKSNPTGGAVAGTAGRRLLPTAAAIIFAVAAVASLTATSLLLRQGGPWTLSAPSGHFLEMRSAPNAVASPAEKEYGPPPRRSVDSLRRWPASSSSTHASSAAALTVSYEPKDDDESSTVRFCVPWEVDTDDWWMHHSVNWTIALEHENATHTCYQRRRRRAHVQSFQRLYNLQYSSNQNCTVRKMWSDGFGSDLRNVMDGLDDALRTHTPFTVDATPWHYVTLQDLSNPACRSHPMAPHQLRNDVTMNCFFLPISNCSNRHQTLTSRGTVSYANRGGRPPSFVKQWHLLEYVLRPRQWLRRQVQIELDRQHLKNRLSDAMALDGAEQLPTSALAGRTQPQRRTTTRSSPSTDSGGGGPCTVVHVRRGDSVLGNSWSTTRRNYRPLSEYLRHVRTRTVLLLTDDANAIEEAHSHFPNYTFVYWNRTRYRGSEGGWEEHLPSRDPVVEMATLLGTFQLVRQCRAFIHTSSNLGQLLYAHMVHDRPNGVRRVNLDSISVRGDRDKK